MSEPPSMDWKVEFKAFAPGAARATANQAPAVFSADNLNSGLSVIDFMQSRVRSLLSAVKLH